MAAAVKSHNPFHPSPDSAFPMSTFLPHAGDAVSPAKSNNRRSTDSAGHLLPQVDKSPVGESPTSAGPSPLAPSSNGTEIDDTAADELEHGPAVNGSTTSPQQRVSVTIITRDKDGNTLKSDSPEANPASVIHAPKEYLSFHHSTPQFPQFGRSTPTPSQRSDITVLSSQGQGPALRLTEGESPLSPPPIDTTVPPVHDLFETPRAQTILEGELEERRKDKRRQSSLENIPEDSVPEESAASDDQPLSAFFESDADRLRRSTEEVAALKDALSECWTLCNTLAGLSSLHRERAFRSTSRQQDGREQAWKSCWKLCQKLYDTRDEDSTTEVGPTLDLCRDFCQSLFEVRQKGDDVADSVLRVSFELNNHLYNMHDRSLPELFRERTMDFYITLCHRLMKQRNAMVEETDSLLRACWGLAEMLFSLRQNRREGKPPNEELLGSAVQACWELCDLFREGWTQVRPDRGTPRPSSIGFGGFGSPFQVSRKYGEPSKPVATISVAESSDEDADEGRLNPETPTTIFEDTNQDQFSPDDTSVPNILVLGPESSDHPLPSWSSSVSDVSSSAASSISSHRSGRNGRHFSGKIEPGPQTSSSTSTIITPSLLGMGPGRANGTNPADDARLACLKLLIVRAAAIIGFDRAANPGVLQQFVKSAPSASFGTSPWQMRLLEDYKKLVAGDAAFRTAGTQPTRADVCDVARAVRWMVRSGQYVWLEDLFRWVLGYRVEEAEGRRGVWLQV